MRRVVRGEKFGAGAKAGRRTVPSRKTRRATRGFPASRFSLSRFPFFKPRFISSAHQTTFFKKKKTYRNVFGGTAYWSATSRSKNRKNSSKMSLKRGCEYSFRSSEKCKIINSHRQKRRLKYFSDRQRKSEFLRFDPMIGRDGAPAPSAPRSAAQRCANIASRGPMAPSA